MGAMTHHMTNQRDAVETEGKTEGGRVTKQEETEKKRLRECIPFAFFPALTDPDMSEIKPRINITYTK